MLRQALDNCQSIVDLGCGSNPILSSIKNDSCIIGMDSWYQSCLNVRHHSNYSVACQVNLPFIPLRRSSIDAVVMLQVLEHLPKELGFQLIGEAERVALKSVVLTTPNGFIDQGEYGGNPDQQHRSGWTTAELETLGYTVFGYEGIKGFRKRERVEMIFPGIFWELVVNFGIFDRYVYERPNLGFQLLAIKKIEAR